MINEVVTAITRTLANEFSDHDIYTEEIPEGFDKKSFFVKVLTPIFTPGMDTRFNLTISIDVHYWGNSNKQRNDMAMKLYDLLNVVTSKNGNKFRSFNPNGETIDGCLHFFVTYRLILTRIQAEELMESLEIKSNVKGE